MKRTFAAALAVSVSLIGCTQKVTEVPFLDKVLTANEFNAQPPLREKVLVFCADDPGRYRGDPNCVNAQQASRLSMVGSGDFPRIKPPVPAWATGQAKDK